MLKMIALEGVGPSPKLGPIKFAKRMNFITGDNGLGKSFLLDIAWWVLTRNWARGLVAVPSPRAKTPTIRYAYSKQTSGDFSDECSFIKSSQTWPNRPGRPPIPGLVLYAGVDGSFSVWDPARNYWTDKEAGFNRPTSFDFSPSQVWEGLRGADGTLHSKGLIQDWVLWQQSRDPVFSDLTAVLKALSPGANEHLEPGNPVRIGMDVTDYPSLKMPYNVDVPLIHASAGMRRICALAYLLVWTWREHTVACKRTGKKVAREIIFLLDEIECHLHPEWQRRIIPALLDVMKALTSQKVSVQLLVATHSPLVLASTETLFDEDQDKIFTLQLSGENVEIDDTIWAKQGDVVNWLVSEAFGLKQARSVDAERAIEAAEKWMRGERKDLPEGLKTMKGIHAALLDALPGGDEFWPRWIVKTGQIGAKKP